MASGDLKKLGGEGIAGGIEGAQSARKPKRKLYRISTLSGPSKNRSLIAKSREHLYEGSICERSTSPGTS